MRTTNSDAPRAQVRERLIQAAGELIAEIGWGQVSTRKVAQRAGVSPGVVHYYVENIDELRRIAAFDGVREVFVGPMRVLFTYADRSRGIAEFLHTLIKPDPGGPQFVILYESLVQATRDPVLRTQIAAMIQEFRGSLTEWLAAGDVADPKATATVLTAAIDGFLLQRALDPTLEIGPLAAGLSRMVSAVPVSRSGPS